MNREQINMMQRLLDLEAGVGFTQKALDRLTVVNMIADALRAITAEEAADQPEQAQE
jgi:hypothetical protein